MTDEYPACPDCGTNLCVEGYAGLESHICRDCGTAFDAKPTTDGRRPEVPWR